MSVSIGSQSNSLIPVAVNLTNTGYNEINGSVQLSVVSGQNIAVWNGSQDVSNLLPLSSKLLAFNINIRGSVFEITGLPPYQTFNPGQEASFTFKIKNNGNQEGNVEFNFKA